MSGVQVTPGKRGVKRALNASALPPTPQSTRRRRPVDEEEDDFVAPLPKRQQLMPRSNLPEHLQTLLSLHHAFNIALSLHLATHPPVLPPHSPSTTRLQLPNLTTFLGLKASVERTSGRRFGKEELARLAWLWTWDGESLPAVSKKKEDDNPFLVSSTPKVDSVCGLSYLITTTRTLDNGRRVHTHGIGIEVEIHGGETHQLLLDGALGGFGTQGQGGGVRVLGRWSAGADIREEEVRRRLERWVELNGGEVSCEAESSQLPTPSTRNSARSSIPPIPLLPLPKLPSATPAGNLFSKSSLSTEPGLTSSPKKKASLSGLSDPFEIKETKTPAGTPEERKAALLARIKARSSKGPTLGESLAAGAGVIHRRPVVDQDELKRRATLSRLESVAEGVWMMFSAPAPGSGSGTPRSRRRTLLASDVAERIVQSSKTPISTAEAETSLQMLMDLCPFFLASKRVGRHDWLELKAEPPSSPSSLLSSPHAPGRLAGPASPGRVRRTGGLREVRERIRRELGE